MAPVEAASTEVPTLLSWTTFPPSTAFNYDASARDIDGTIVA